MRRNQGQRAHAAGLSGRERGAIEQFLVYIENRVKDVEPVCAKLVCMARLSLGSLDSLQDSDRVLH